MHALPKNNMQSTVHCITTAKEPDSTKEGPYLVHRIRQLRNWSLQYRPGHRTQRCHTRGGTPSPFSRYFALTSEGIFRAEKIVPEAAIVPLFLLWSSGVMTIFLLAEFKLLEHFRYSPFTAMKISRQLTATVSRQDFSADFRKPSDEVTCRLWMHFRLAQRVRSSQDCALFKQTSWRRIPIVHPNFWSYTLKICMHNRECFIRPFSEVQE